MERIEELLLDNGLEGTSYFTGYDYDTAILGYTDDGRLVYSYEKMIEWLTENEEMTQEDAQEWINYNGPCVKTKKQDIYHEQLLT